MGLNPKGRNWGSLVNWDDLGKFYAGFIVCWTVILYAGVAYLTVNRKLAFIKIRNLPLAIAAISFLHVYLVKIFLAYTTNGHFQCSAEFWIMSTYLPFGIALFQANLAQLKSISDQQRDLMLTEKRPFDAKVRLSLAQQLWNRWTMLPGIQRTYVYIGLGMVVQLIVTGALYATTPTLQGDWSSFGHVSHAKGQGLCRKSLEWIPSAFWQLAWSWLYGPYLLFKVRNIHDVHYWRLQVIYSVISGLPGTPLWLASVYSTGFKQVNPWWVPPMWLAPGIIVMQFTTIFFPVYEIIRSRSLMRSTMAILDSWDGRRGGRFSQSVGIKQIIDRPTIHDVFARTILHGGTREGFGSQPRTIAPICNNKGIHSRERLVSDTSPSLEGGVCFCSSWRQQSQRSPEVSSFPHRSTTLHIKSQRQNDRLSHKH